MTTNLNLNRREGLKSGPACIRVISTLDYIITKIWQILINKQNIEDWIEENELEGINKHFK